MEGYLWTPTLFTIYLSVKFNFMQDQLQIQQVIASESWDTYLDYLQNLLVPDSGAQLGGLEKHALDSFDLEVSSKFT